MLSNVCVIIKGIWISKELIRERRREEVKGEGRGERKREEEEEGGGEKRREGRKEERGGGGGEKEERKGGGKGLTVECG